MLPDGRYVARKTERDAWITETVSRLLICSVFDCELDLTRTSGSALKSTSDLENRQEYLLSSDEIAATRASQS